MNRRNNSQLRTKMASVRRPMGIVYGRISALMPRMRRKDVNCIMSGPKHTKMVISPRARYLSLKDAPLIHRNRTVRLARNTHPIGFAVYATAKVIPSTNTSRAVAFESTRFFATSKNALPSKISASRKTPLGETVLRGQRYKSAQPQLQEPHSSTSARSPLSSFVSFPLMKS
jgi:hypothetical protein